MDKTNQTVSAEEVRLNETVQTEKSEHALPVRRVGTVTLGLTLIAVGVLLIADLLFPGVELWFWLRFSPAVLILLGIEILLSHTFIKGKRLKYDFFGAVICFFVVFAGIGAAATLEGLDYFREYIAPRLEEEYIRTDVRTVGEGEAVYVIKVSPDGEETVFFLDDGGLVSPEKE